MKKQKRQAERMPRKMKKRFKKLMKFFDERRKEYDLIKNLSVILAAISKEGMRELNPDDDYIKGLILAKCSEGGITPDDIAKIEFNKELHSATITLKEGGGAIMYIDIKEGTDNADNN